MENNSQQLEDNFPSSSEKISSVTLDKFYSPNHKLADELRECLSDFYGWGKFVRKNTPKGLRRYGENLDELPVEGLDCEQIWQLLSLDAQKSVDAVSQDITKLEKTMEQMQSQGNIDAHVNDSDNEKSLHNQKMDSDDEDSQHSDNHSSDNPEYKNESQDGITKDDINLYDSDDESDADIKDILKRTMKDDESDDNNNNKQKTNKNNNNNNNNEFTSKKGLEFDKDAADSELDKENMFFGNNDNLEEESDDETKNDPEYDRIFKRAMKMDEDDEDDEEEDDEYEDMNEDYISNNNEDSEMKTNNEENEENQLSKFLENMENQIDEWDAENEEKGEQQEEDDLESDDDDGGWFNEDGTLREGDGKLTKQEEKSFFKKQEDKIIDQTEEIEEENLKEKPWMLSGETFSFQRPKESLLEVHMDFDQGSKMAPKTTQETTKTLEDIIIGRIVEGIFDDPEKRVGKKNDQDKKQRKELDHEQSDKGLADVYEEMYLKKAYNQEDDTQKQELDAKLKGIDKDFNNLMQKLDALTNFHYVPKIPESQVEVKTSAPNNAIPALSMEDPTPTAISDADQQRPEDMIRKKNYLEKAANEEDSTDKKRKYRKMKAVAKKKGVRGKEKEKQAQMQNIINSMEYGKAKGKVSKAQKAKLKKDMLSGQTDVTDYTNSKQVFNLLQRQSEKNKKNKDSTSSAKKSKTNQDVSQYKVKL